MVESMQIQCTFESRYFKNLIPIESNVSSVSTRTRPRVNWMHTEIIFLPQEILQQLQGSFRTGSLPAVPPRASSILHGRSSSKAPKQGRLPVILPGRKAFYTAASLHAALPVTPRRNPLDIQGIHLVSTKFYKRFKYYIAL